MCPHKYRLHCKYMEILRRSGTSVAEDSGLKRVILSEVYSTGCF